MLVCEVHRSNTDIETDWKKSDPIYLIFMQHVISLDLFVSLLQRR